MCFAWVLAVTIAVSLQATQPTPQQAKQTVTYRDPVGVLYGEISRITQSQVEQLQQRAEAGDADAELRLGMAYETRYSLFHLTMAQGRNEAETWFRKSAEQGNPLAQRMLASYLYAPSESSEKYEWYLKAAEKGDVGSQASLGQINLDSSNIDEAAKWFLRAAEGGDWGAQLKVASFYECGCGLPKDDSSAAHWYRLAAEQGILEAQFKLGLFYEQGRGLAQSNKNAAIWYRRAAAKYADAAFALARLQASGAVSSASKQESAQWYRKAAYLYYVRAKVDDVQVLVILGRMYEKGLGVRANLQRAYIWYSLAALVGDNTSSDAGRLAHTMTPEQVKRADAQIARWVDAENGQGSYPQLNPQP